LEISLRLNPRDQRGLHLSGIGIALFFNRRFAEALDKLLAALQKFPGYATPYRFEYPADPAKSAPVDPLYNRPPTPRSA